METTYIVLLALLVVYIPIYIYVRKSEKAHEKGFGVSFRGNVP